MKLRLGPIRTVVTASRITILITSRGIQIMKNSTFFAVFLALACLTATNAGAQGGNGRGACKPEVFLAYYKVLPGKQDEWLTLYKQWHLPIMRYEIEHGATTSAKIFASGHHSPNQSWDFIAIITYPPAGQGQKALLSRPEAIEHLFPDVEAYVAAEKRRWEITVSHWDEKLVQLDPDEQPFSVYEPLKIDCD